MLILPPSATFMPNDARTGKRTQPARCVAATGGAVPRLREVWASQTNRISLDQLRVHLAIKLERHIGCVVLVQHDLLPGPADLQSIGVERASDQRIGDALGR